MFIFLGKSKNFFSSMQQFLPIKNQIIKNTNQKFKVIGLLDQVHKLDMDRHILKEYIEMFQTINFSDFFAQKTMKAPLMTNISLALTMEDLKEDAQKLLIKAYQVDEVELLRQQLKQIIYEDDGKINVSDLINKWSYTSTEDIAQLLESHSILKQTLKSRIVDFDSNNFHQILYFTYLLMGHKTFDTLHHQQFVKSFSNTSNKDLEPLDLILIAKGLKDILINSYSQEIEKILKKFDHYLEKLSYQCTIMDRVLLLEQLQGIDIPQKIPSLSNPLLTAKIPPEHFANITNALLQYEDPVLIQQKIINNIDNITTFSDCISILLGLSWCNNFPQGIFMPLLRRIELFFQDITDIVTEMPQEMLPHCCKLYQVIVSMQMHNAYVPYMNLNIPVAQLQKIYIYRIKMNNHVDFSQNEQDISDILYSLDTVNGWKIIKIERQVKVSLFSVDFRLILQKGDHEREMLLDVLGGSLFVSKKAMGRKALWRYNMLSVENDVKFVNLTEWHTLSQESKVEKIKSLINGRQNE